MERSIENSFDLIAEEKRKAEHTRQASDFMIRLLRFAHSYAPCEYAYHDRKSQSQVFQTGLNFTPEAQVSLGDQTFRLRVAAEFTDPGEYRLNSKFIKGSIEQYVDQTRTKTLMSVEQLPGDIWHAVEETAPDAEKLNQGMTLLELMESDYKARGLKPNWDGYDPVMHLH